MIEYGKGRMLKAKITDSRLSELYKEYIDTYGEYIPSDFLKKMNTTYQDGLHDVVVPYYLLQFYDEYNMLLKQYNLYEQFIRRIKQIHPDLSNKTILDVGGGIVPSLGRKLAKEAKHVIVVDKDIADINNPSNLEVIKKEITNPKELPNADLIVGFMPNEATNYLIDHAFDIKSDFLIEFSGYIPDDKIRLATLSESVKRRTYFLQLEKLLQEKIEENELGTLVSHLDIYDLPYPIMGNKRKCTK